MRTLRSSDVEGLLRSREAREPDRSWIPVAHSIANAVLDAARAIDPSLDEIDRQSWSRVATCALVLIADNSAPVAGVSVLTRPHWRRLLDFIRWPETRALQKACWLVARTADETDGDPTAAATLLLGTEVLQLYWPVPFNAERLLTVFDIGTRLGKCGLYLPELAREFPSDVEAALAHIDVRGQYTVAVWRFFRDLLQGFSREHMPRVIQLHQASITKAIELLGDRGMTPEAAAALNAATLLTQLIENLAEDDRASVAAEFETLELASDGDYAERWAHCSTFANTLHSFIHTLREWTDSGTLTSIEGALIVAEVLEALENKGTKQSYIDRVITFVNALVER